MKIVIPICDKLALYAAILDDYTALTGHPGYSGGISLPLTLPTQKGTVEFFLRYCLLHAISEAIRVQYMVSKIKLLAATSERFQYDLKVRCYIRQYYMYERQIIFTSIG